MDVYWSETYPNCLYVHLGENDLRVIRPNGVMYRSFWFYLFTQDELADKYKFEFIGTIEPEETYE